MCKLELLAIAAQQHFKNALQKVFFEQIVFSCYKSECQSFGELHYSDYHVTQSELICYLDSWKGDWPDGWSLAAVGTQAHLDPYPSFPEFSKYFIKNDGYLWQLVAILLFGQILVLPFWYISAFRDWNMIIVFEFVFCSMTLCTMTHISTDVLLICSVLYASWFVLSEKD